MATQLYLCHDYGTDTRTEFSCSTTVADELNDNVMIRRGISEREFVNTRTCRDSGLKPPALLLPAVQFNMRAGHLPTPESSGQSYFKLPIRGLCWEDLHD